MPVIEEHGAALPGINAPANGAFSITPSDANELTYATRAIAFSAAGILHVTGMDGVEATIPSGVLAAGIMHPLRVKKVWADTTTATNIWGFK